MTPLAIARRALRRAAIRVNNATTSTKGHADITAAHHDYMAAWNAYLDVVTATEQERFKP